MPRLKPIKPAKLIKLIRRMGFVEIRQKGSHVFFGNADGRTTVVPVHAGEEIDRKLLTKIIKKDLKMKVQDFHNWL